MLTTDQVRDLIQLYVNTNPLMSFQNMRMNNILNSMIDNMDQLVVGAGGEPTISSGTTAQYFRGDKTWQAHNAASVGLGNVPNINATIASNLSSGFIPAGRYGTTTIPVAAINATGTPSASTILFGNGTWGTYAYADGDKGDVTISTGGTVITLNDDAITLNHLPEINQFRVLGRVAAGVGDVSEINGSQLTAILDVFNSTTAGIVPLSGGGTTNFLRADGTWAAAGGAGTLADDDYGDVTVSSGGSIIEINALAVTNSMINDVDWGKITGAPSFTVDSTIINGSANAVEGNAVYDALLSKQDTITTGTTAQYFRGDLSLATFPTVDTVITDGSNNAVTGNAVYDALANKQNTITTGTTGQYFRGDLSLATFPSIPTVDTSLVDGSTNAISNNAVYDALAAKQNTITTGTTLQYFRGDLSLATFPDVIGSLTTIGATPNANAATITGTTLQLQPANASFGGIVTTGTQAFSGFKEFSGGIESGSAGVATGFQSYGDSFGANFTSPLYPFTSSSENTTAGTADGGRFIRLGAYTAAAGNAIQVSFEMPITGGTIVPSGFIVSKWTEVALATRKSSLEFHTVHNASSTAKMSIASDGILTLAGYAHGLSNQMVTVSSTGVIGYAAIPTGGGGGLSDGSYTDIIVSSTSTVMTIANNAITTAKINALAVTDAKINDVAFSKVTGVMPAARIAGTATDGLVVKLVSGVPTWSTDLSGGGLSDGTYTDITLSSSASVWTIVNNAVTTSKINNLAVTDAKINDVAATKVTEDSTHRFATDAEKTTWNAKQDALVSGTSIKTVNGNNLLGSGNLVISGTLADGSYTDWTLSSSGTVATINNNAITTAKIADANVTNAKLANSTISFAAIGTTGTAPTISASVALGASATLNIPYASGAGVIAGLVSRDNYDYWQAKVDNIPFAAPLEFQTTTDGDIGTGGEGDYVVEGSTVYRWNNLTVARDVTNLYSSTDGGQNWTHVALTDLPIYFPSIIKYGSTYYSLGTNSACTEVYVYSSANKINWTALNGGSPVITRTNVSTDWRYQYFNCGFVIINEGGTDYIHYFLEGVADGASGSVPYAENMRVGYAKALLSSPAATVGATPLFIGGNVRAYHIREKNALLLAYGEYSGVFPDFGEDWILSFRKVSLANDLTDPDSYIKVTNDFLTGNIADPSIAFPENADWALMYYNVNQADGKQAYIPKMRSALQLFESLKDEVVAGGGSIGGTLAINQLAVGSASNTIGGSSQLTFDGTTLKMNSADNDPGVNTYILEAYMSAADYPTFTFGKDTLNAANFTWDGAAGGLYIQTANANANPIYIQGSAVHIYRISTGLTAPTTSGTTKMVICDSTGKLSFDDIPSGGGGGTFSGGIAQYQIPVGSATDTLGGSSAFTRDVDGIININNTANNVGDNTFLFKAYAANADYPTFTFGKDATNHANFSWDDVDGRGLLVTTYANSFPIHLIGSAVNVYRLSTGLTAPTTSGTTKMVISDTNGKLSFTDIPGGSWVDSSNATTYTNNGDVSKSVAISNNDAGTATIANFRATNGTNTVGFGVTGTGYTPYGILAASTAHIYTGANLALISDGGYINFGTSGATEVMRLAGNGSVSFSGSFGSSGQVLTSAGTGAPPTWETPTGGGGSGVANMVVINDTDYTVAAGVTHVVYSTLTAARTVTLPTASSNTNRKITVKHGGQGAFSINISPTYRMNSTTTASTIAIDQWFEFISDGTDWYVASYEQ